MNIVLGEVLDVTAIISDDLFRGIRIIVNIALDITVGVVLVCEDLEESDAPRSWAAQHDWG
jgi:hypothetical protein